MREGERPAGPQSEGKPLSYCGHRPCTTKPNAEPASHCERCFSAPVVSQNPGDHERERTYKSNWPGTLAPRGRGRSAEAGATGVSTDGAGIGFLSAQLSRRQPLSAGLVLWANAPVASDRPAATSKSADRRIANPLTPG